MWCVAAYVGLARTLCVRCVYGIFGREITIYGHIQCKYTVLAILTHMKYAGNFLLSDLSTNPNKHHDQITRTHIMAASGKGKLFIVRPQSLCDTKTLILIIFTILVREGAWGSSLSSKGRSCQEIICGFETPP